ncbi:MAG: 2Fe-2S iron-sulfur cluster binding domain-containing protein [Rhodobacteraceae bacterium]|nr:2Fe-2S iron-sulfur cluster binding domain-containing protein [Paracoccaceae bacterium]
MTATPASRTNWALIGRRLRVTTGLIMLAYVTSHLLNLVLGLHSVRWVELAQPLLSGFWSRFPVSYILLLALIIHFGLALNSLYRRETLRIPNYDKVQLLMGLAVIPLLAPHVFGIIATKDILGQASYRFILEVFWIQDPVAGLRQVLVLGAVWIHGCIGLFTWIRTVQNSEPVAKWLYPLAVAIPVMALLGYVEGGRQVLIENLEPRSVSASQGGGRYASSAPKKVFVPARPPQEIIKQSKRAGNWVILGSLGLMLLTLIARSIRIFRNKGHMVEIHYSTGEIIEAESGPTLLDLSRLNYIPHANICRGRGRCGTCRVRILSSDTPLARPAPLEQNTLDRLEAESDVRLACQLVPGAGKLVIEQLVSPAYSPGETDAEDKFPVAEPAQ